ncbi:MAG: nitrilase-related carbon-nitrogen hydrolase, partial [Thermomicrobiales bacterium]
MSVTEFTPTLDVDRNTQACKRLIERASQTGTDIVVLPEAAMYPPPGLHGAPTIAQDLDGQFVTELSTTARRTSVHVVAGMFRPGPDGKVFNTLVSIGHDGSLVGKYDKIHLYDAFTTRESDEVAPGPDSQRCDP